MTGANVVGVALLLVGLALLALLAWDVRRDGVRRTWSWSQGTLTWSWLTLGVVAVVVNVAFGLGLTVGWWEL